MADIKLLAEPNDVLYRIKRGLSGYISYLAACEMNQSFSEYVLYEPILRVLTARGYSVQCEVPCPGVRQPTRGDRKKLDFVASGHGINLAMEVKWAKKRKLNIENDLTKLRAYLQQNPAHRSFLCVFGKKSDVADIVVPEELTERGTAVFAEFGRTRFGCRIYELVEPAQ